jgi:potassium-transporting ATPase KdpC subunit
VLFPSKADGSRIERDGEVIGSRLVGQQFKGPQYFRSRPSATGYAGNAPHFNNLGPNQEDLRDLLASNAAAYARREGVPLDEVPVDAVTTSASGVDPHISEANARIQANRVADARDLPLERVQQLIVENTDDRTLGLLGEPGVNVLELNLALDEEAPAA